MERKITAEFNTTDEAAHAIKEIRERFDGILEAQMSYHMPRRHRDYTDIAFFTPSDMQFNDMQNSFAPSLGAGAAFMPVLPVLSDMQNYSASAAPKAFVELRLTDKNAQKICDSLHCFGGTDVRMS